MIKCTNCGNEISPDMLFAGMCIACGTEFSDAEIEELIAMLPAEEQAVYDEELKKNKIRHDEIAKAEKERELREAEELEAAQKRELEEQQKRSEALELERHLMLEEKKKYRRIVTSDFIEGYVIDEYMGPVYGTDIYLVGGIIGGGLVSQHKLFGQAFTKINATLLASANEMGANAVIGANYTITPAATTGSVIVVGTGTAVHIRKQ